MKIFTIVLFSLLSTASFSQRISNGEYKTLQTGEDSLKVHAFRIIEGINPGDRFKADSIFTRILVRTLKTGNSFYYPFDSLQSISKLYAPDSSFRIFTWQMVISTDIIRQHGAIQMRTPDGSLKIFPLIDKSDVTQDIEDSIGNNYGWMGAVYYKIILTKYSDHNYYTLIGFDQNNYRSDRKIIEVLTFANNEPVFGGHYFTVPNDQLKPKNPARYIMEYKKEAGPRLNYDDDLKTIVMEHLVSESNEPAKKYTYIGDGDYEGFRWQDGKWIYISKLFNQVTPDGKPPVPEPVKEDKRVQPVIPD